MLKFSKHWNDAFEQWDMNLERFMTIPLICKLPATFKLLACVNSAYNEQITGSYNLLTFQFQRFKKLFYVHSVISELIALRRV